MANPIDVVELLERLRDADRNSVQRTNGSTIFGEAADTIERLRALLKEVGPFINKVQLSPERIEKASRLKSAIADETAMIAAAEGGE